MSFWDRFVWAVYFGMAQRMATGREAAVRIIEMALSRHAFLAALNDTSLLLLLALSADNFATSRSGGIVGADEATA